jgi:hypothetical protein
MQVPEPQISQYKFEMQSTISLSTAQATSNTYWEFQVQTQALLISEADGCERSAVSSTSLSLSNRIRMCLLSRGRDKYRTWSNNKRRHTGNANVSSRTTWQDASLQLFLMFLVQYSTAQHSTAQHSTAQHSTAQYSTAQHSTVPYSTVQYSTVQYNTAQHSTAQHSTAQHSTVQYSTVQYSTAQHSTAQYSTVQYSTAQHSTVQYSTLQYSTVQYSTVQQSTVE